MTAEDVVFSHYKLLDEGLPSYAEAVGALIPRSRRWTTTRQVHLRPEACRART